MPSWLLRGVLAVSLVAASVLTFAAARERWGPACPRGGFDSAGCVLVQSHEMDYLVPTAPWQPVGHAAELSGLSLLALALAAALLPFVLHPDLRRRRWRVAARVVAAVPAAALALLGVATLRAGLSGEPATGAAVLATAFVVWAVAWPAALLLFACLAPSRMHRAGPVTIATLVGLATPVPVLLVLGPSAARYSSYDTAPWSEATAAPLLLTAAVVVCASSIPVRRRQHRGQLFSWRSTPSSGSPAGPRRGYGRTAGAGSARS